MAFYNRKLLLAEDTKVCAGPCIHPPLPPASKHPTPTISVLWLGILGAAFLFLSYFALRWFASRRRSSPRSAVNSNYNYDHNNREDFTVVDHPIWFIRTLGLPQSAVDSIQMLSYGKGDGLIESSDCSVCLSEFQEGDTLRLLPKCSHAFHVPCIDTWLRSHTTCPLCRAPILQNLSTAGELSESESETERVEDDGVVIDQEQPVEPMRRSVSMDFCSHIQPKESFSSKRSISFSLYA